MASDSEIQSLTEKLKNWKVQQNKEIFWEDRIFFLNFEKVLTSRQFNHRENCYPRQSFASRWHCWKSAFGEVPVVTSGIEPISKRRVSSFSELVQNSLLFSVKLQDEEVRLNRIKFKLKVKTERDLEWLWKLTRFRASRVSAVWFRVGLILKDAGRTDSVQQSRENPAERLKSDMQQPDLITKANNYNIGSLALSLSLKFRERETL